MLPPQLSLRRALARIREQGPAWLLSRLAFEAATPTTRIGQRVFHLRARARYLARRLTQVTLPDCDMPHPDQNTLLFAFYDLSIAPITYDCLWFLVGAEHERKRLNKSGIHIIVVPGNFEGLRREYDLYEKSVDIDARQFRIYNLLIPAFMLLPSVKGITLAPSREGVVATFRHIHAAYPKYYDPALPVSVHPTEIMEAARCGESCQVLRAPVEARRAIQRWRATVAGSRRIVTITLRNYEFGPARNSDINSWAAFAKSLDPDRWCVVFLADTSRTFDPIPPALKNFQFIHEASWTLPLRAALYEASWLNLGTNSGPMLYPHFSHARGLMFRIITPGVEQTTPEYCRALGFVPGEQPASVHPFYRWVWEHETPETIRREFDLMLDKIERTVPDSA